MNTSISARTIVVRSDEPIAVEMDHATVMMSLAQGMYFGLEGVGPRIWALLVTPRRVSDLCDELAREFDVAPATCLDDVCGFLEELHQEKLIRIDDEPTDAVSSTGRP
jgi:hypothetical protein